jgi:multiple sugar transport system substrate-binding protein
MPRPLRPAHAAVLATTALLAGCLGDAQHGPDDREAWYGSDSPYAGLLEIEGFDVTNPTNQARHDRAVEQLGTAVEVSVESSAFDARSFASSAEAGDAPDLVYASRTEIGFLAARGAVLPLERCVEAELVDLTQYAPAALNQVIVGDRLFAIPDASSVQVVAANDDWLSERGLSISDINGSNPAAMLAAVDETAAESDAADADADADAVAAGIAPRISEFLPLWAGAQGIELLTADGRTATLDDPRMVEALSWAAELTTLSASASDDPVAAVISGDVGATVLDSRELAAADIDGADVSVSFDTVRSTSDEPRAVLDGYAWAIPTAGANPSVACAYAISMTTVDAWLAAGGQGTDGPEGDAADSPALGLLTSNVVADAELRDRGSERADQDAASGLAAASQAIHAAYESATAVPANPAGVQLTRLWRGAVEAVLAGDAEAATALAEAQTEAQQELDRGWADLEASLGSRR